MGFFRVCAAGEVPHVQLSLLYDTPSDFTSDLDRRRLLGLLLFCYFQFFALVVHLLRLVYSVFLSVASRGLLLHRGGLKLLWGQIYPWRREFWSHTGWDGCFCGGAGFQFADFENLCLPWLFVPPVSVDLPCCHKVQFLVYPSLPAPHRPAGHSTAPKDMLW